MKEKVYCTKCKHLSDSDWGEFCRYVKGYKDTPYEKNGKEITAWPETDNKNNHCKYYEKGSPFLFWKWLTGTI